MKEVSNNPIHKSKTLGPWKASLRETGGRSIINTIIFELNKNVTRKFSYSEYGYLKRWMNENGKYGVDTIKRLLQTGIVGNSKILEYLRKS